MKITEDKREMILCVVKKMLENEDVEVMLEELPKNDLKPVNNRPIVTKKNVKLLLIMNNNGIVKYDEEAIAKILAK